MNIQGINIEELLDDEVLFFIRIRGKISYFESVYPKSFLCQFKRLTKFRTISEYKRDADVYIDINKFSPYPSLHLEHELIDKLMIEELEIIRRCRGLRMISYLEAHELIIRVAKFFIDLFYGSNLKLIVMGVVDNYVMDIMCRMSRCFNITCLGMTESFLAPDYKLVTTYGEHVHIRDPDPDEIKLVFERVKSRRKSSLVITKKKAWFNAVYVFSSYYYRFIIRYLVRYKIMGCLAYEYRFTPCIYNFKFNQLTARKYLKSLEILNSIDCDKAVYIPLHYFPEATVDYWVENSRDANYLESVLRVVRFFSEKNITIVLKEHPAFYLLRPIEFYQELSSIPNVILLEPYISTKQIFDSMRSVVVWTGSSGVEAAVNGLNVSKVTNNYYSKDVIKYYCEAGDTALSDDDKQLILKKVLQTSIKV